jgi:hypothetical protein
MYYAMNVYGKLKANPHAFLTAALHGGEWRASPLPSRKETIIAFG